MKWTSPEGTVHKISYATAREIHKVWTDSSTEQVAKKYKLPESFVRFIVNRIAITDHDRH